MEVCSEETENDPRELATCFLWTENISNSPPLQRIYGCTHTISTGRVLLMQMKTSAEHTVAFGWLSQAIEK